MLIIINKQSKIPLIGLIQIGIIDRGTNLLQIRPTTICNLDCIFCSTNHPLHQNNYIAEKSYLIETLKEIIKEKQTNIEANIDSVGEPTTYENLIPLIEEISKIKEVNFISMQTNGTLLTKQLIKQLEKANLNRINLSIHTLDENKAKILANNKN
ncbi:radical SAM protein, partial [Candidatus Woesearchaeota archaeon]|nr:radical SAM protein [Candidatus Woesearchaeota archaeon]